MRPCEHETRYRDIAAPGKKLVCGRIGGLYETIESLATIRVALCRAHLNAETGKGRKFRTIEEPPTTKELQEMRKREAAAARRSQFLGGAV